MATVLHLFRAPRRQAPMEELAEGRAMLCRVLRGGIVKRDDPIVL